MTPDEPCSHQGGNACAECAGRRVEAGELELVPVRTLSEGERLYGPVKWWTSPHYRESVEAEEMTTMMKAFEEREPLEFPEESPSET